MFLTSICAVSRVAKTRSHLCVHKVSTVLIQVELVDENGPPSKLGSGEVGDQRGEVVRGDGDGDLVVGRVRSGVGDEGDGVAMVAPRVRGVSESEERRSEEVGGAGQPFTLAVSVGPEGKGGPKRCIYFLR